MEEVKKEYMARTKKSAESYKKASKFLPKGVGSSFQAYEPYPIFYERAKGSKIWDVDGNESVDFNMAFGALFIGHAHPLLISEIRNQLEKGTLYCMPTDMATTLAEEIIRRYPVDMVRFTNSGSDSTMYAIRLARGYTGKDKIVKIEGCYHGAHDYVLISIASSLIKNSGKIGPVRCPTPVVLSQGVPRGSWENTLIAPFNNIKIMEEILENHIGEVAAVIVEPVIMNSGIILPKNDYLQKLRALTRKYNVLLIFDEVKTGFKIAPGGACEYFNVEPDIVTFAKAIGGGFPLGAFAARKKIMETIGRGEVAHLGTYNANPLCLRAGIVTLTKILNKEAYNRTRKLSEKLANGCKEIIKEASLPAQVNQIGPSGCIFFTDKEIVDCRDSAEYQDREMWYKYWLSMFNNKIVLPNGCIHSEHWTISVQHTEEDISKFLETFRKIAFTL